MNAYPSPSIYAKIVATPMAKARVFEKGLRGIKAPKPGTFGRLLKLEGRNSVNIDLNHVPIEALRSRDRK